MMSMHAIEAGFVLALSATSGQAASPLIQLIPFALVLGIFYFVVLLPMRRRQKKVEAFLGALKAGDRVVTSGGLYGVITKVNGQSVQLQVAQNVKLEVALNAIVGYQGQAPVVESTNA
jgi:preprotein translocase subunit YajC